MTEKRFRKWLRNDSRMKEVMENPKIAKALDLPREKAEFYELMKGKKGGGLTKGEMKEIFGELMSGKGRTISRKETYAVAKEFFGDEKVRYILPEDQRRYSGYTGSRAGNYNGNSTRKTRANVTAKNIPPSLRASIPLVSSENQDKIKGDDKKGSFFRALEATDRNKK